MKECEGKKILILGGTSSSLDIVKTAQKMGAYVIVTDDGEVNNRVAKQIANETAMVSTSDIEGLIRLVNEKNIDGAFCGPSEFNIKNLILLCEKTNLPCYATLELWNKCADKQIFKDYCIKNNVLTAPQYDISFFKDSLTDKDIEYPLIVKPVDGCSSKGISICNNRQEVIKAYDFALLWSECKRVIIEKYIDNGGQIFSFRYILDNGNYYPYLTFDTHIVDPINKKYLISAFTYLPSDLMDIFLSDVDRHVQEMFSDMGLKNGVAFIQGIPYEGKIYCHEMGYRLSGGMIYKITERMLNINDMKIMLRYALGEQIITNKEIESLNTKINRTQKEVMAQLMIPLQSGIIGNIEGVDEIKEKPYVVDFLQYYQIDDEIKTEALGTLGQHFGRYTLCAKSKKEMIEAVNEIQSKIRIKNKQGADMFMMKFDTNRLV